MKKLALPKPYLIFLGDTRNILDAKTALGLVDWCRDDCLAQISMPGCKVDLNLPEMNPSQAAAAGAKSIVIGIAPTGGQIKPEWRELLKEALSSGLHLISGLHTDLEDDETLREAGRTGNSKLINLRKAPDCKLVASGKNRTGKRLLTVGTDCCVGKKYTALSIYKKMKELKLKTTFRATGQTGILISGEGIPIDAVVSDFVSGAAESLSPENDYDHWDIIEGQGSLFHPAYSAVTLGLIHGSQPDAMILCHSATRTEIDEYPGFSIPPIPECISKYEESAALTNPKSRVVGISINSSQLDLASRTEYFMKLRALTKLPCFDPINDNLTPFLEILRSY